MKKIVELITREPVLDVLRNGSPQTRFANVKGHILALSDGVFSVTASAGDQVICRKIPVSNVSWWTETDVPDAVVAPAKK